VKNRDERLVVLNRVDTSGIEGVRREQDQSAFVYRGRFLREFYPGDDAQRFPAVN
jgi:hypothetical protein